VEYLNNFFASSGGNMKPIKVLVVDDQQDVRRVVLDFLNRLPNINIVGEAVDGDEAIEIAEKYRQALSDITDLMLPHYNRTGFDHVYQNYTVRSKQGNDFSEYLKSNGIEVLTQFRKPYYKHEGLKLIDRGFPETESFEP
jgi:CheY-like chemotaxis protein